MQLRSRAGALTSKVRRYCDTSSLSSSSSASNSDSEDDPNFQISPEASDVEDISVVLDGGTSVPSAVSLHAAVVGNDSGDKSLADSSLQPELSCPTPTSRQTLKNGDASFQSAKSDTSPVAPLLSRIRPCHVVLDRIDPLLESITHRPPPSWLKKEEQSVGARDVVASAGAEIVEPVRKGGQSRIRSGRKRTPENVQFLPETPTSMEDQEIHTPPSCGSVRGSELHERGQKHARVVNGSFIGHRPFRVTCRTNDRAESEPVEVAISKDNSWEERGEGEEGADEALAQQQQRTSYSRRHAKVSGTVHGSLSHSDSEVDILHVHEDPPARVRSSRRKSYRPRRVDPSRRMCLVQEEWLTPYKFGSEEEEEVMKDPESPSLLAHTDLNPPDVQDPMDETQVQSLC